MSLVGDTIAALDALIRGAVPAIPAGARGVEIGWRDPGKVDSGDCPHVFFYDPRQRPEPIDFGQKRIEVALRIAILRNGQGSAQSLDDFNAISAALELDPTLGGVLDDSELALDLLAEDPADPQRIAVLEFSGLKEQ